MNPKIGVGIGLGVFFLAAVVGGAMFIPRLLAVAETDAAEQGAKKQKVILKVKLPTADAKVTVDKMEIEGDKSEREISHETKNEIITIVATWEPNGYTKFFRTRKVAAKDGATIEVDMRTAGDIKDHIEVIYVPTPDDVVEEMCKLGKVTKDDVVYDLGCGDGRMVIAAVKKFGAKKGVGVDINPVRVKECKENAHKAGADVEKKLEFRQGDVLKIDDLPDASVVLLYMGEDINLRLRPILKAKLKPGSRIVSHRFTMGDWTPTQQVEYRGNDNRDYTLLLWVIDGKSKK